MPLLVEAEVPLRGLKQSWVDRAASLHSFCFSIACSRYPKNPLASKLSDAPKSCGLHHSGALEEGKLFASDQSENRAKIEKAPSGEYIFMGFPCGSAGRECTCSTGDLGSTPGLGRSPREGKGYPLQYSGLEDSMNCIVHGVAKSQTWLSNFHFYI